MKLYGVLDRIEDGKYGVVLVEELKKEFILEKEKLPSGTKEGMWLCMVVDKDEIQSIEIDKVKTDQVEQKVQAQLERIRKRRTGSKFKRN